MTTPLPPVSKREWGVWLPNRHQAGEQKAYLLRHLFSQYLIPITCSNGSCGTISRRSLVAFHQGSDWNLCSVKFLGSVVLSSFPSLFDCVGSTTVMVWLVKPSYRNCKWNWVAFHHRSRLKVIMLKCVFKWQITSVIKVLNWIFISLG